MNYPKRLIEIDLPIRRISEHARDEKDSRCGHIPRLHIYPAARPVAACRAIVCAALWLDPADPDCPSSFRKDVEKLMIRWAQDNLAKCSKESFQTFNTLAKTSGKPISPLVLRAALLDFIADFANWDNSIDAEFLATAKALTQSAHREIDGSDAEAPLAMDFFAGGGALPLEALRVGANVHAGDSNPLAVLINRVVLQYAPKFRDRLADAISEWGNSVNAEVKKSLSEYFPADIKGQVPIAYLWARTVLSEAPDGHANPVEIPLIRSMWLSRKGVLAALRWKRDSKGKVEVKIEEVQYANGTKLRVRRPILEIFSPKSSSEVEKGTVARNSATCPVTGHTTPAKSVQKQLIERFGGAADARLYCVVSTSDTGSGRFYALPTKPQLEAYRKANEYCQSQSKTNENGYKLFPDEPVPVMSGVFNAPLYGHSTWGSLFNSRQLLAMTAYVRHARGAIAAAISQDKEFGLAFAAVLGLAIDRLADLNASLCVWQLSTPNTAHVFGRWALPMIMDYGEVNPLAGGGGSPESAVWRMAAAIKNIAAGITNQGDVTLVSADALSLPDNSVDLLVTDPPYYNAVPYADISDFFYVWLRRVIGDVFPDLFSTPLTPKIVEICEMSGWDPNRYGHKDKAFFETKMRLAMQRARTALKPSGVGVVVFAHKSTAGWEAMLQALVDAGWTITASWPIDTEMASRLRAKNSAVLASSVHLVCRPREMGDAAHVGEWRNILHELPVRIHEWMPRLADEGVVGADAIFACLGPALEIFSRHARVEKANGEEVKLQEYLEHVWASVAKEALAMVFGGADTASFEPDARLTAMWLWTMSTLINGNNNVVTEATEEESGDSGRKAAQSGFSIEYDAARKIGQGLGANLEALHNLVEVSGDVARLLSVGERSKYLLGLQGKEALSHGKPTKTKKSQIDLFKSGDGAVDGATFVSDSAFSPGQTVLDRLHQSMILFSTGRGEALRRFLVEDAVGRDLRFWQLAQALSALYPSGVEEKRWVDGVLARKKSLGF